MAFFNHKIFKPFKNIFILILAIFVVWMIFFDANSWFIHHDLNKDVDALESEKEYYKQEIEKDKKAIKKLTMRKNYSVKFSNYLLIYTNFGSVNVIPQQDLFLYMADSDSLHPLYLLL